MSQTDVSDQELIQQCLRRESGAWELFVEKYFRLVVHVVRDTLKNATGRVSEADVDDLAMEVYAHILENDYQVLRNLREPYNLKGWLSVSARNRALGHATRRPARTVSLDAFEGGPDAAPTLANALGGTTDDTADRIEALRQIIDESPLTPREMLLITLSFYERKSYREIATFLGISENTVGPALSRTLAKLREEMRRKGWER